MDILRILEMDDVWWKKKSVYPGYAGPADFKKNVGILKRLNTLREFILTVHCRK